MARNKGAMVLPFAIEPSSAGPLDARAVVSSVSDLILSTTWSTVNGGTDNFVYPGMIVSVSAGPGAGIYRLGAADYAVAENWIKLAEGEYTHPENHPADIITETDERIFLNPTDKIYYDDCVSYSDDVVLTGALENSDIETRLGAKADDWITLTSTATQIAVSLENARNYVFDTPLDNTGSISISKAPGFDRYGQAMMQFQTAATLPSVIPEEGVLFGLGTYDIQINSLVDIIFEGVKIGENVKVRVIANSTAL